MRRARFVLSHPLACGAIVGLYASRLVAEAGPRSWRLLHLGPLVVGLVALGMAGAWWLARRPRDAAQTPRWGLVWFLLAYIVWPRPDWAIAAATLGVTALLWMLSSARPPTSSRRDRWLAAVVFIASLTLYTHTLYPDVLPADSGEFQLVCAVLGIAHPPGYPFYTMVGKLFALLPFGTVAWRINLYGAVCGALTLAVVAHAVQAAATASGRIGQEDENHAPGSWLAALVAAGFLGLGATFWAQSTTANIRGLTALFVALCLALLLHWGRDRSQKSLIVLGICFGLAVGHHSSIALLGLPFGLYVMVCEPCLIVRPRRWLAPLGAFFLSLLVLAYLPLRSLTGAPFDPSPIRSLSDWVSHVLALGFRGDFLYFRTVEALAVRGSIWRDIMGLQFGPVLPWAALLATVPLARRDWRALLLLGLTWLVNALSAISYRAPQTVEYLIPSYVAMASALGYGLGLALFERRSWHPLAGRTIEVAAALLLIAVLWMGAGNYPSLVAVRREAPEGHYVRETLQQAPADTLILSNWHHATAFWFVQQIEGLRPDVEVRYVYPEGALSNETVWLRRIAENVSQRPVIVTNRYHAYRDTAYQWVPFHGAWLVSARPDDETIATISANMQAQTVTFGDCIEVLGYSLDAETAAPGHEVRVTIHWRPLQALDRDYSSFVQLVGPSGVVGQADIAHRSSQYVPGGLRVDAYRIPLLMQTSPGAYQLITGYYHTIDSGWERLCTASSDYATLQTVKVTPGSEPAASLHPMAVRYQSGLLLMGADYDRGVPGKTRVYLHWRGTNGARAEAVRVSLENSGAIVGETVLVTPPAGAAATVAVDIPDTVDEIALLLRDTDGAPLGRLGPWHRRLDTPLTARVPDAGARYVPLGGEMVYVGMDIDLGSVTRGETLTLTPRFLTLRPLTNDYSVSVGLVWHQGGIECKSDSTPAMGAIPTLKWIRGWRVRDPHEVTIAPETPTGEATARLAVYDAFTLEPLAVLDERLVRQGQGTWLDLDTVEVR